MPMTENKIATNFSNRAELMLEIQGEKIKQIDKKLENQAYVLYNLKKEKRWIILAVGIIEIAKKLIS